MAIVGGAVISASADSGLDNLIDRLDHLSPYFGEAEYSVTLPSAADDIVYTISLQSHAAPSDTLNSCNYLIEWSLPTPSGLSEGFSAYFDGNHYRYHDGRIQEYHYGWDSIPFITGRGGVQRNAQFVELLPQNIALQLRNIADSGIFTYKFSRDTIFNGRKSDVLTATETRDGYTARELLFVFDSDTAEPLKLEFENNPGAISEQTVSVIFIKPSSPDIVMYSEEALIARYPEQFGRFRQCNFRVENLPGTAMPAFSLPTPTGERYTRHKGDTFKAHTLIAVIDPAVSTAAQTVSDIRSAMAKLPFNADMIYAFVSNDINLIDTIIPSIMPGETIVMNARSLARDCGITAYPTIIFVGRDGIIGDIQLGFNNNLSEVVIQKMTLLKNH